MDNSLHTNEDLLIRYLDDELSPEEKNILEQRLVQNKALADELEILRLAREATRQYGIRQQVKNIHTGMRKQIKPPVRQISRGRQFARYSLAVAASILIIVIAVLGYNFYTLSPTKLYSANYQSYELTTLRSGAEPTGIEKAYRDRDFSKVVEISKDRSDLSRQDRFLVGVSNMEKENFLKAIEDFRALVATNQAPGSDSMKAESEYYLALAYMKNRDYDQALTLMNKIYDDPNHPYHEKISGKLIRKVKMLKWR